MLADYQALVSAASSRGAVGDWMGLGCALFGRGYWGSASGCFARVVGLDAGDFRAWANWGWCAHQMGDEDAAWGRLTRAVELAPAEGRVHTLMSQVELTLGREAAAVRHGLRGVELEGTPVAHVGYALALMNAGEWEEGWREYEWRLEYKMPELLTRPYRLWRGERVRHLYIEAEQGIGDSIFALRWVLLAAERAERVTLFVQRELYGLFVECAGLPGNVAVRPLPRPLPGDVDAWVPMMSLPAALELGGPDRFHPSLVTVADRWQFFSGGQSPWLTDGKPRKIGIVWAGGPVHESGHLRDVPLTEMLRLAEVSGVELHALQVGSGHSQLAELGCYGLIRDRGPELTNFLETAKVLAGLDLVITVDTAVAHLAGAMGMPCWMIVNQRATDFRWGRRGEATGWYPTFRLFRRDLSEATWGPVMGRVEASLRELVAPVRVVRPQHPWMCPA